MSTNTRIVTLAITGASGIQYGLQLLKYLVQFDCSVSLLVSESARQVAKLETDYVLPQEPAILRQYLCTQLDLQNPNLQVFSEKQWEAPIASGSFLSDATIVCPCSCNSLSAFARGASANLIERAVDVTLKERRLLILVPRETPLSVIHLENMLTLTRVGAVILPASPGFYHRPNSIDDLIVFMVAKILDQLKIEHQLLRRWGSPIIFDGTDE